MKENSTTITVQSVINDFELATHRYLCRMRHVAEKILLDPDEVATIVREVRESEEELTLCLETLRPFLTCRAVVDHDDAKMLLGRVNQAIAQRKLADRVVSGLPLFC